MKILTCADFQFDHPTQPVPVVNENDMRRRAAMFLLLAQAVHESDLPHLERVRRLKELQKDL